MTLCREDGVIIGTTALDAIANLTELHVDADLLMARVELVVEADGRIEHVISESRGRSSRRDADIDSVSRRRWPA
jgi:hypothetical protein